MGTATYDIVKYGRVRGSGPATVAGDLVTSGAHTTTTTASDLTDGAAGAGSAITATVGTVLHIQGDEAMRIAFGGDTATATLGHILFANETREIEVPASGAISIIDVA